MGRGGGCSVLKKQTKPNRDGRSSYSSTPHAPREAKRHNLTRSVRSTEEYMGGPDTNCLTSPRRRNHGQDGSRGGRLGETGEIGRDGSATKGLVAAGATAAACSKLYIAMPP